MQKWTGVLFLIIFSINTVLAQQAYTVEGKLETSNIDTKEIKVFLNEIATTVSTSKSFEFKNINSGNYTLKIVDAENKTIYTESIEVKNESINVGTIKITKPKNMKAAVIVAEKKVVQTNFDKKVFNVEKNITGEGGSASDILKNVPGISVDGVTGDISIRGSNNVMLLIDGKPSSIFGDDVASALQSIPASSIENVEVINNPSAKYDAQGKAGIVNIILKKDRKAGINGTLNAGIGYPFKANAGINMNANIKKWNFFLNGNVRTENSWIKDSTSRKSFTSDSIANTYNYTTRNPNSAFVNFGFDYNINNRNKITLSENFFGANMFGDITTDFYRSANAQNYQHISRYNEYIGGPRAATTNLNYKHNFKKQGQELAIDASYSMRKYARESDFNSNIYDGLGNLIIGNVLQSIPVRGNNNNLTASADFTTPLKNNFKLDFGAKTILFEFNSENFPTQTLPGGAATDVPYLKNKFNFNQETYAAYTNLAKSFKHDISAQFGLRYEHFLYDGFVFQYNTAVKNKFSNLFPSLYLNKKLQKQQELNLNYTRRVNRPNFFQLIPYIDITNPQDTVVGNPNLIPELIHAVEFGYTKNYNKNTNLISSIYMQYTDGLIQRYRRFNSNGTTYTQSQNLNSGITYGAEVSFKHNLTNVWDANWNLNVFNNVINGSNIDPLISRSGYSGFAKLISTYKFKNSYDAQITANYQAPVVITQGTTASYFTLDAGVKKTLFKGMLVLNLNATDILNTTYTKSIITIPNQYEQSFYKKPLTRTIMLTARLRFANKKPQDGKMPQKPSATDKKENKVKSRDENLKKDEGSDEGGGAGGSERR